MTCPTCKAFEDHPAACLDGCPICKAYFRHSCEKRAVVVTWDGPNCIACNQPISDGERERKALNPWHTWCYARAFAIPEREQ